MYRDLISACDNFEHRGSGWRLKTFVRLELVINISNPLRVAGCTNNEHILPLNLAKKHALLQVTYGTNYSDNHCFKWAVYAALYSLENPEFQSNEITVDVLLTFIAQKKEKGEDIDFTMFDTWPISVWYDRAHPDMGLFYKFELKNDISVNIYTVSGVFNHSHSKCF